MGLFDRFKKKEASKEDMPMQQDEERLENVPGMLIVRLLFNERPVVDPDSILEQMKTRIGNTEVGGKGNTVIFSFPDIQVHFSDAVIPAQCALLISDELAAIPEEAFRQNWHWPEAAEVITGYKHEIMLSNLMSGTLEYKTQFEIFMNFVAAVTAITSPLAIYSVNAQKIIQPEAAVNFNGDHYLAVLTNVRLFNLEGREEILMDTVGLSKFGLPDLQCMSGAYDANSIAGVLWNYLYYIFENGDVIESGNTLQGIEPGSKWKCTRSPALVGPDRVVLNIASQ